MAGNDAWIYQGRQYHQWFGHGTKPKDAGPAGAKDALPSLEDRIHAVGHTLVAGLPPSKRHHAGVRLDAHDHGRLDRLLTGVAKATVLGPRLTAVRVLGQPPDAPGIAPFVKAGGALKDATTRADVREGSDLVAQSALAMGLDRFKPFLREADDHLTREGGLVTLARDVTPFAMPETGPPKAFPPPGPKLPLPGEIVPTLFRALGELAGLGLLSGALQAYARSTDAAELRRIVQKFGLDPSKPEDAAAAVAYAWAEFAGSWPLGIPMDGPGVAVMAERVMRAAQADPELLARAMSGDAESLSTLRAVAQDKLVPGFAYEVRDDEERALVVQMVAARKSEREIQAALDELRRRKVTAPLAAASGPEVTQLAPTRLRFSQRTAGGNGGVEFHRNYVRENGTIKEPVDVVRTRDGLVTIDNTRVAVAREMGLKTIPVRIWNQEDALPDSMKRRFKAARTWGEALQYRTAQQRPPLPHTGTVQEPRLPRP